HQPTRGTLTASRSGSGDLRMSVRGASRDTAIVVKVTRDSGFSAALEGSAGPIPIEPVGPDFMLLQPARAGNYDLVLRHEASAIERAGRRVGVVSWVLLAIVAFA